MFGGDCAGKKTFAEWSSSSGATGDRVIARCQQLTNGCLGKMLNVDYLWECKESHVPNCGQTPGTTNAWLFIGECVEDTGMGGANP